MSYGAQILEFWNQNQKVISIVFACIFLILAFTKRKFLTFIMGVLSTVMVNFAFNAELTALSSTCTYQLNAFLYEHGLHQLLFLSSPLVTGLTRTFSFWIVKLVSWLLKRIKARIRKHLEKARQKDRERKTQLEAARIKAQVETEQKKIADTKAIIASSQDYRLNIFPFLTAVINAGLSNEKYKRFFKEALDFRNNMEQKYRQADADAEDLKIPVRTVWHQK